ncbi:unnamed protein product, partial [marine sediment metagenome]
RLQDIKIIKADLDNTSAVLLRFHDGYVIKVNQKHPPVRQNFSCAHEIGHALLSELQLYLTEDIEYRTLNPQTPRVRERLCDIAATELLMPEYVFGEYLSGFGISVHSIERLANIFNVSKQAAAFRIAEVSPEPCLALLWQPWPKNKPKGLRLVKRTGKGINSQNRVNYMPKHNLVKPPSTLHEAYKASSATKSFRNFKIDNTVKRLSVESKGYGYGENRYVISLAFLNNE